jgi:citrate lyase subunit beta / citryl-CoA lyase
MRWVPPGPALLFCPADRPERYAKAAAASDVVILDLEDGVNPEDRVAARRALAETLLDPERTVVRVNPTNSSDHSLDLEAVDRTPYDLIMLSKTESADQVNALYPRHVIALCETPGGVLSASDIAAAQPATALMWGAEDLVAGLEGRSSRRVNGTYRDVARFARCQILLAAAANGCAAIDAVHIDIGDLEGLRDEAADAVASGFVATACIHPTQVEVVREAYRPTAREVAWAHGVLETAMSVRGVFTYEGRMVDAPLLRHAERIVRQDQPPQP